MIRKKWLELAGLREDIAFAQSEHGVSERRVCKLLGGDRASYRYEPRPDRNVELCERRHRRKRLARERGAEPRLTRGNQEWAVDFIVGGLANGRMVRILSVVDASFHGRLRDECLNANWFRTLNNLRLTLECWREVVVEVDHATLPTSPSG